MATAGNSLILTCFWGSCPVRVQGRHHTRRPHACCLFNRTLTPSFLMWALLAITEFVAAREVQLMCSLKSSGFIACVKTALEISVVSSAFPTFIKLAVRSWLRNCVLFSAFSLYVGWLCETRSFFKSAASPPTKFYTSLKRTCVVSPLTWMQISGQEMGLKGGQEDEWSPLSPAGRKEGERRVCWVIHSVTLSFPAFLPSSSLCSLNPLITKSFLVQCLLVFAGKLPVIVLSLPAPFQ